MNNTKNGLMGVFDSGFGGLSILRGITKELPGYNYIYLGDTARTPYGNRPQKEIYEFTKQAVDFLFKKGCQLIILACNTASSEALHKIQCEYLPKHYPNKRVLGMIIPAAEEAVEKTKNNKIGVIATEGTVSSKTFEQEIIKLSSEAQIFQQACPLLVPLIESGKQDSRETNNTLKEYLTKLTEKGIDTLILGCTHYSIIKDNIIKIIGDEINIICEEEIIAPKLKDYLERHPEIESRLAKNSTQTFFTTGQIEKFALLGSKFFGKKINPEQV